MSAQHTASRREKKRTLDLNHEKVEEESVASVQLFGDDFAFYLFKKNYLNSVRVKKKHSISQFLKH